jgi:CelD/BcsL family acetyltransferase involved in cellulose biosynthesis
MTIPGFFYDAGASPAVGATARASMVGNDRLEIVADPSALAALKEDWNALYARAAKPYFSQSFSWCWTSWRTVSEPRGRRLHCIVARRGGRAVLIWPFVTHRLGLLTIARPLGPETTEYTSVLVEDGPETAARVEKAWTMLRQTCRADIIALPLVRAGSELHRLLAAQTIPAFIDRDPACHVSRAMHESWDQYRLSLPSDMRKGIARRRRRLQEKGELVFEPSVVGPRRAEVIDWLLAQKRTWLAETKRHNPWLLTHEYRNFLIAVATDPDSSNGLLISVLRLGDQIIAADVFRRDRNRIEDFLTAYDPAFAAFGPGQMILEECLHWSFVQGLDFDLRIGSEGYKKLWTKEHIEVFSYEFASTYRGSLYVAVRNTAQRLSRLLYRVPPEWRRRTKSLLR